MTAVNYLWNPLNDNIVAEYDDAGNTIAEYTTEPEQFGNVVSQRRSGVDSYYHYDGVGSTLAVTDSTGAVTDTRSYTAFGETTEQTGTTVIPYQYVGRNGYYRDEELGQYSVRHRNFRPNKASWDSVDPLLTSQMSSPYVYSHNDPLARIDPSGLIALIARTDSKNNLGCGAFRWETTWVLPGVEESGYVVQYMTIERSLCANNA